MYDYYLIDEAIKKLWVCREGDHLIDIIPNIGGEYVSINNLHLVEGYFVVCPKDFGKICRICDSLKILYSLQEYWEVAKSLKPKKRCLYNIICYDSEKEYDKGVQLWSVPYWYSERCFYELSETPTSQPPDLQIDSEIDDVLDWLRWQFNHKPTKMKPHFADPKQGYSITFSKILHSDRRAADPYIGFRFNERERQISAKHVRKAFDFPEIIKIPTKEDFDEIFRQQKRRITNDHQNQSV